MSIIVVAILICVVMLVLSLLIFKWESIKAFFKKHFGKKNDKKKTKNSKNKKGNILKASESQFRPIVKPPEEKKETATENNEKKEEVDKLKSFSKLSSTSHNTALAEEQRKLQKKMLDEEFEDVKRFLNMSDSNKSIKQNNFFDNARERKSNFEKKDFGGRNFPSFSGESAFLKNDTDTTKKSNDIKFSDVIDYQSALEGSSARKSNLVGDDDIDLSKLPPRLKKFVLSTILQRKDFDD